MKHEVVYQRGFSAQVEIKLGIRRDEKFDSREQIRLVEISLKNQIAHRVSVTSFRQNNEMDHTNITNIYFKKSYLYKKLLSKVLQVINI